MCMGAIPLAMKAGNAAGVGSTGFISPGLTAMGLFGGKKKAAAKSQGPTGAPSINSTISG